MVRPKKHLGQHFLKDESIAHKIVDALHPTAQNILEIGPGTGVLTKYLLNKNFESFKVAEIDRESIAFLSEKYPQLDIISQDVLKLHLANTFNNGSIHVIGNFPYNISSQILFKIIDERELVTEAVGMFQKEVCDRIVSKPGTKAYGILSVILQTFYDVEYLFTVPPEVFIPPPKVFSGVVKITRNNLKRINCDYTLFKKIVKQTFGQRRKKIRNTIKPLFKNQEDKLNTIPYLNQRPEELSSEEFQILTNTIEKLI